MIHNSTARKAFGVFAACAAVGTAFGGTNVPGGPSSRSVSASASRASAPAFRSTTGSSNVQQATTNFSRNVASASNISKSGQFQSVSRNVGPSNGGQFQSRNFNANQSLSSIQRTGFNQNQGVKNFSPNSNRSGYVAPWLAKPGPGQSSRVFSTHCDPHYYLSHGCRESYGYCYKGYDHCHWQCRSWSNANSCWLFYDQGCCSWYYWCQPTSCYYPCSYKPYGTFCCTQPVCNTPYCAPQPVCDTPYCAPQPVCESGCATIPVDVTTRLNITAQTGIRTSGYAGPVLPQPGPAPNYGGQPIGQPQPAQLPPMPGEQG